MSFVFTYLNARTESTLHHIPKPNHSDFSLFYLKFEIILQKHCDGVRLKEPVSVDDYGHPLIQELDNLTFDGNTLSNAGACLSKLGGLPSDVLMNISKHLPPEYCTNSLMYMRKGHAAIQQAAPSPLTNMLHLAKIVQGNEKRGYSIMNVPVVDSQSSTTTPSFSSSAAAAETRPALLTAALGGKDEESDDELEEVTTALDNHAQTAEPSPAKSARMG